MKGLKNKRQHFIPQCYLKCFSENDKFLWIYNKNYQKVFRQSISRTACQDDFYKIPEKYIALINDNKFDPNFFEKEFFDNMVEHLFGPLLKAINRKAEEWITDGNSNIILSQEDKEIFAELIAIQYLRMPNMREKNTSLIEKRSIVQLEIIKAFYVDQYPENKEFINSISGKYDNDHKAVAHANVFSHPGIVNNLQSDFLNKIWIFYVSESKDFYTSDNPVLIFDPHLEQQPLIYEGLSTKGVELIFPIGHSVLLTLWDKDFFKSKCIDNKFQTIDDKSKRRYNLYQYSWANGELYSRKDNFDLIEKFKQVNGGEETFLKSPKILVNGK